VQNEHLMMLARFPAARQTCFSEPPRYNLGREPPCAVFDAHHKAPVELAVQWRDRALVGGSRGSSSEKAVLEGGLEVASFDLGGWGRGGVNMALQPPSI
jgi:hypothetical protein